MPLEFLSLRLIHTGPPAARQLWVWSPKEALLMCVFLLLWIMVFCVCLSVPPVFPVTSLLWCIWEELLIFGRFSFLLVIKMKVMTFFTCPAGNWKSYHPNRKSIFFCLMIKNSNWNLTSVTLTLAWLLGISSLYSLGTRDICRYYTQNSVFLSFWWFIR